MFRHLSVLKRANIRFGKANQIPTNVAFAAFSSSESNGKGEDLWQKIKNSAVYDRMNRQQSYDSNQNTRKKSDQRENRVQGKGKSFEPRGGDTNQKVNELKARKPFVARPGDKIKTAKSKPQYNDRKKKFVPRARDAEEFQSSRNLPRRRRDEESVDEGADKMLGGTDDADFYGNGEFRQESIEPADTALLFDTDFFEEKLLGEQRDDHKFDIVEDDGDYFDDLLARAFVGSFKSPSGEYMELACGKGSRQKIVLPKTRSIHQLRCALEPRITTAAPGSDGHESALKAWRVLQRSNYYSKRDKIRIANDIARTVEKTISIATKWKENAEEDPSDDAISPNFIPGPSMEEFAAQAEVRRAAKDMEGYY